VIRAVRLRPGVVLLATLAGFALAHALDYALVFPEPAERAEVLRHSGHGYLPLLAAVAWPLLGLAVGCAVTTGGRGRSSRALRLPAAVALLAGAQSAFFVTAEVGERVGAHESPAELFRTPLLAAGLAAQVVVAALLVALLALAEVAGRRWRALAPVALAPAPRATTPYVTSLRATLRTGLAAARAPPCG
jgi:hypothetical protein